jgi:hypothetical protein
MYLKFADVYLGLSVPTALANRLRKRKASGFSSWIFLHIFFSKFVGQNHVAIKDIRY